jgi:hypothetical protein
VFGALHRRPGGCGKRVIGYGRGDGFDAGKRVGDDVLAGYVTNILRELRDEVQMVELPWRTLVPPLLEGEGGLWSVRMVK